jgi:peptidoglycan/LPS O-acetylase OafA/YrhL
VTDFLGLRLARIYPVHVATLLCVAAMVVGARHLGYELSDSGYSAKELLLNVFLLHAWTPHLVLSWNYPSWSISSEWFAYLLFPFLVRCLGSLLRMRRGAMLGFFVAAAFSMAVLLLWEAHPFRELAIVVPTFFAGMAASHIAQQQIRRIPPWAPMVSAASVLVACYLPGPVGLAGLLMGLFGLIVTLALRGAGTRIWAIPPLIVLGEISYSLYMAHTLAQKVLYRVLPAVRFVDASALTRLAVLTAYAGLVTALCALSYVVVERPCREWGRRRLERAQGMTRGWSPSGISG